jgi:prevent-host-death family protein
MNATTTQRTITQRELRNESAAIMDAVEAGESMVVTRNGVPVAELRPIKRAREISTGELRRIFATSPAPDYALMRAEIDAYFGEDRIGDDE